MKDSAVQCAELSKQWLAAVKIQENSDEHDLLGGLVVAQGEQADDVTEVLLQCWFSRN